MPTASPEEAASREITAAPRRRSGQPRLRVALAGLGIMGNQWLKTILASREVELAAVVEPLAALAGERIGQYKLEPKLHFAAFEDALRQTRPDAVIIVTPPALHLPMSLAALELGIPVLSEKPLADSLAAGQAILQKANETGVLHVVAQDYRYQPRSQTVKQVLASGELGPVGAVSVQFFKSFIPRAFHDELTYPLTIDMSIHHFDMLRFFLDSELAAITGRAWRTPWDWYKGQASTSVLLQFRSGAAVTYEASWVATGQETPWNANWRFECENGVLLLHDDRVSIQRRTGEIGQPKGYPQYLNERTQPVRLVRMPRQRQAYLLDEFVRAVVDGVPPATTVQDNIKSFRMVWDTIRSFETGETVLCQQ